MVEECKWDKCYKLFKNYLRCKPYLQIDGATYGSSQRANTISLNLEQAFIYSINTAYRGLFHKTGTAEIVICKSGVYIFLSDVETQAPAQFTVFVNGIADPSTTDGGDSGAGQVSVRQLLPLCKGDVVTLVNHQSFLNPVTTTENAGGTQVGSDSIVVLHKIAPLPRKYKHPCKKECEKPCKKEK